MTQSALLNSTVRQSYLDYLDWIEPSCTKPKDVKISKEEQEEEDEFDREIPDAPPSDSRTISLLGMSLSSLLLPQPQHLRPCNSACE